MGKEEIKKQEKKEIEVITAVYKVNLHCPQCARDIRGPLLRTPGVHSVDVKYEKNEVTVKGIIEAKKVHERLKKWSKKKVELISEIKSKDAEKGSKETKKEIIKTTLIKAYMHCAECERQLRRRLIAHKGIHNVKTDIKAQTISIEGVIEQEKLLTYMRKRVHKYAEIIPPKEKKEDKKDEKKEKEKEKEKEKVEIIKVTEKIVEFKEVEKVGAKTKEGDIPYFVHFVHAPQLFSDENPHACSVM